MGGLDDTYYGMTQRLRTDELENEKKQLEIDKYKQDIKIGQRTIRYWWIPITVSVVSALAAVVVPFYIHYADATDKLQMQEQLKDLQQKLQQTNANTVSILDSLLKIEHRPSPTKK